MSKIHLLFLPLIFLFSSLAAQQPDRCGFDLYLQMQIQKDPSFQQKIIDAKEEARKWSETHPSDTRNSYIVPVVVHVIYHTANQNLSDQQVQSQIDVLNEDYNRINADTLNTPDVFKPVAGSVSVKFCLAAYDPDGNETNGITRTSTDVSAFYLGDSMKSTALGGDDPWPATKYLNIWTCNLSNGVLGYSTIPSGGPPPENDGVVIRYNAFGREGVLKPPFTKGRTCTHEVGHWLGLDHTFSGGCSDGDGCNDTPPEESAVYGCPTFPHISCNNGPDGDMFMDYMDYTDDGCMNMFTQCQAGKMTTTLEDPDLRLSIQSSSGGCQGVNYNLDASISTIAYPTDSVFQQGFVPQVQLTNRGIDELTYVKIGYQVDGQTPLYSDWNGSLTSLVSTIVALPAYFTGEGGHVFYAWTTEPNHGTDEFIYNDTASSEFIVKSSVPKNTSSIIPSLTGDIATITVQNPSAATMNVQLINAIGQVMYNADVDVVNNSSFILDLTNYAPGLYIIYGKVGYDFVKEKIMVVR